MTKSEKEVILPALLAAYKYFEPKPSWKEKQFRQEAHDAVVKALDEIGEKPDDLWLWKEHYG